MSRALAGRAEMSFCGLRSINKVDRVFSIYQIWQKSQLIMKSKPEVVPAPTKETLAEGKFIKLSKIGTWEFAERNNAGGAVVIVAVTKKGKLLMTEQFRVPLQARVIEMPAGLVGDIPGEEDEAWAVAAQRELLEETGYAAKKMKHLTTGPVSAGFGNETMSMFLAKGIEKIEKGGGVEGEDIVVHEVPLHRVPAWLRKKQRAGVLVDPKVYACLYFALQAEKS
jgi:ADP-ribose pyrophosphatase